MRRRRGPDDRLHLDGNNVAASLAIAVTSLGGIMRLATSLTGGRLELLGDPMAAAHGAAILNTDVWRSMGMEAALDRRRADLAGHPSLDAPASLIARQAENRLHVTKAALAALLSYPDG
jgi:ornithine carbamoyltransferase